MKETKSIDQLIKESGNNFHCKVLNYLKEKDWSVLISPYYNDNVSDKPREIDLIAEKAFGVQEAFGGFKGNLNVKLFIECKYISQNVAFWFHDKDANKAKNLVLKTTPLRDNNYYTEQHRYINDNKRVAKLFTSDNKKNSENEPIYKALNQSLNAMVYYRGGASIIPSPERGRRNTLATVNYPVIVCNSFETFYKLDIETIDNAPKNITEHFQLEVNYAYMDIDKNHSNEYFLIDVVNFEKPDTFLETLQKDVQLISSML